MNGESEENEKRFLTLENNEIWFSKPDLLNDPYECQSMFVDYDQLALDGFTAEEVKDIENLLGRICYIASFTDSLSKNFPMWTHYANKHKGFCVKYKVVNPKNIYRVDYEEQRKPVTAEIKNAIEQLRIIQNPNGREEEHFKARLILYLHMRLLAKNYSTKHKSWEYESEYRALKTVPDWNKPGMNVYVEDVGLHIAEVYIGNKCQYYDRIKKITDRLGVPCSQCRLDNKEFLVVAE